ncbi:AraC family transcriptional regulator [Vagococcus sp. BWB3-3]|uniref:AraC family transcriptional regulator n=1 Tax=Vagococcus allomyrinae TaxID=2794353 RepID=A0A940PER3_9ENTE|nr:AraC family transcriptional regulator [Vagococcus allomyrinae]
MKKFISKCRNGLLFRYFVSYLLIFLLPFLILTSCLYYWSVLGMEKQLKTANLNSLRQVDNIVNERFSELDKMADNIKLNPRLSNFMLEHPYYSIEGRSELSKIQASNAFVSEIFLHYINEEKIYSSNGSQSLSSLTEKKYGRFALNSHMLEETFKETLPTVKVSYDTGEQNSLLQYYKPLMNGGSVYGTAFFFIQEAELQRLLTNLMTDYAGSAFIVTEEGQVVNSSSSDQGQPLMMANFGRSLLEKEEVVFEKEKYHVSSLTSDVSGLTFVTVIEAKQFLQPLATVRNWFYFLILAFLSLGLVLSYVMGLHQYRPIKQIDNAFKKITNQEEKVEDNELTIIERRLRSFVTEHQTMNETLSQQQAYLLDYFFNKLMEGKFKDEAYLRQQMSELSIDFQLNHYYVMLLDTAFSEKKEENVKKKTVLLNEFPLKMADTQIYAVELPLKQQLALIVGSNQAHTNQRNHVKRLKEMFDKMLSEDVRLDVGEVYEQLVYLNRSYIEAISANDCHKKVSESVFFYRDIVYSQPQFLSVPNGLKSKLTQSVHQGDETVATETINTIFGHPSIRNMNTFEAKYYYFDALRAVIECISQLGCEDLLDRFNEMIDYQSVELLHQELLAVTKRLCQLISVRKAAEATQLESDIIVYVNRHFRSHDLSLERIAVEFDFSLSYLSRFIKEETGITFSTYVQELRLDYIKHQLVATTDSIKDIVVRAGYYDVSNYTRKFKSLVGVTPGQFRKQAQDDTPKQINI